MVGEFVLVPDDAWLASGPGSVALRFRSAETAKLGDVAVMKVVAVRGDLVEVVNLTSEETRPHCEGTRAGLDDFRLRLFVKVGALRLVTRAPVVVGFPDGTGYRLERGLPIGQGGFKWDPYRVEDHGLALEVAPPLDALASSYPAPGAVLLRGDLVRQVEAGQKLLMANGLRQASSVGDGDDQAPVMALGFTKHGTHTLTTVRTRCVEVVIDSGIRTVQSDTGSLTGDQVGESGPPVRVPAAAPIFWPEGSAAGETRVPHIVSGRRQTVGDHVCFDGELPGSWNTSLCYRAKDLGR